MINDLVLIAGVGIAGYVLPLYLSGHQSYKAGFGVDLLIMFSAASMLITTHFTGVLS